MPKKVCDSNTSACRAKLLQKLVRCQKMSKEDPEAAHVAADDALLHFLDDSDITIAFRSIRRWYA